VEEKKKRDKIQYTVPKLAPLSQGDYLVSEGAGCSPGTGFNTGTCTPGASADQCNAGSSVVYCTTGISAQGSGCHGGISAQGHICSIGSMVGHGCDTGTDATPL
jgi:hypothetical protein